MVWRDGAMKSIHFGQVKAIGSSDTYDPRIRDTTAITAAIAAGLVRR